MIGRLAAQNWGVLMLRGIFAILLGVFAFVSPGTTLAALILVFAAYATVDGVFAIGAGLGAHGGPRWLVVLSGALGLAIGLYAFVNPGATALALVFLIGYFAIVRGVAEVATAIQMRKMIENEWLVILSGAVSILFGAFLVIAPGTGALAVLWLIGYYALFAGVMYLVFGWRLRGVAKA